VEELFGGGGLRVNYLFATKMIATGEGVTFDATIYVDKIGDPFKTALHLQLPDLASPVIQIQI
jgi:hypothetical protein